MNNDDVGRAGPHDKAAEMGVLGSMLLAPEVIDLATERLDDESFYVLNHQDVFTAIMDLAEAHDRVDLILLRDELKRKGILEKVGGVAYLTVLMEAVPTSANVEYYASIVADNAARRELLALGRTVVSQAAEPGIDVGELVARVSVALTAQVPASPNVRPIREFLAEAKARMERQALGQAVSLPTGIGPLDRQLGGLERGELVVICADRSVGKTALANNILLSAVLEQGVPAGYFSAEVLGQALAIDLMRIVTGVDWWHSRRDSFTAETWKQWHRGAALLNTARLYVDDTGGIPLEALSARATRLVKDQGVRVIAIDYIQLITTRGRSESESVRLMQISHALKALAQRLAVPVIVLSQVTYNNGKRQTFYSRAIEQDADVIVYLERTDTAYDERPENEPDVCTRRIIIGKGRHKGTGWAELTFDKPHLTFWENEEDLGEMRFEAPQPERRNVDAPPPAA